MVKMAYCCRCVVQAGQQIGADVPDMGLVILQGHEDIPDMLCIHLLHETDPDFLGGNEAAAYILASPAIAAGIGHKAEKLLYTPLLAGAVLD